MNKYYIVVFNKKDQYMIDEETYKNIKRYFLNRESFFFKHVGKNRDSEVGMRANEINRLEFFECDESPKIQ